MCMKDRDYYYYVCFGNFGSQVQSDRLVLEKRKYVSHNLKSHQGIQGHDNLGKKVLEFS